MLLDLHTGFSGDRWSGFPISLRIFHGLLWSTQSKALTEVDIFLEFPCFFYDLMDVGNLISSSSVLFKPRLYIWKFLVHILLNPGLKDFEHYLASMWNESNCPCPVVWAFFGIACVWDGNKNLHFLVLWPLLSFPNFLAYWVQHFHSIIC